MAEAADENAEAEAGGGKKNIIIFAVALVVAIGASVGGTMFFLGSSAEPETATQPQVVTKAQAIYHNMRPPYVINYLTGAKPRYLQAEFTVMTRSKETIEAVILHMPLIRSEIVNYLAEQDFLELQTQEGKEKIRNGIVDVVNGILRSYEDETGIESVLITNFVLQ